MTTDNVFILFKETDFNAVQAVQVVRCIDCGGRNIFVDEIGGLQFYLRRLFVNFRPPIPKKMVAPNTF